MPHATAESHRAPYIFILCAGLLALLPFLFLTLYNHPQADDYGFAVRDMTYDFWETQVQYYMHWSGRYFSTASANVNPLISRDFTLYKQYSLFFILLFSTSGYLFLRTLFRGSFNVMHTLALAALLTCLLLSQMPSVSEGFYWLSGYLGYQLPNLLMLLMLVSIIRFFQAESKGLKATYIAIAALLCIAIVGSNEMSVVLAFTTTLFIVYNNWNERKNRPYLLPLFVVCVLACLVAVLAPGNYVRMESQPNASKPLLSVLYAALLTFLSFYKWLTPVLLATILYIFLWGLPLVKKKPYSSVFSVHLRHSLLYFIGTLFLMQFVYTWAVGERPTPRVENVIYFFFVFGWLYIVQVALHRYGHLLQAEQGLSPVLIFSIFTLFVLEVFDMESNIATAYTDLASGKAAAYDEALGQRYARLRNSGCDSCAVAPLPAIPQTLYLMDIMEGQENSSFWVNADYAAYWDKAAIYLKAPNPEAKDNATTLKETGKQLLAR